MSLRRQRSPEVEADQSKRPRTNQHLPTPQPKSELYRWVYYYWHLGFNDKAITSHVLDHFDKAEFGLSSKSVQRIRKKLHLEGARQSKATFDTVRPFYEEIRELYPNMGARAMVTTLRQSYNLKVPEKLLNDFLKETEPEQVRQRKYRRFKRKRFWSAGVMDVLTMDQHDKLQRFGLRFHLGFDPFPGRIAWLRLWWSNRNPKVIAKFYLDSSRERGGVPLVSQSDPGPENYGPANCQTAVRHRLDPSLQGTRQHRWKGKSQNVKPESVWSQLRRNFFPGIENVLERGFQQGLLDMEITIEKLTFRYLSVPLIQALCDSYVKRYNSSPRRPDKNKVLPQGIPDIICAKPHLYNTQDFTVKVPPELFDEMEAIYAPPDDPAFQLTPPEFQVLADKVYSDLGSPPVTLKNLWDIYSDMLDGISSLQEVRTEDFQTALRSCDASFDCDMPLLPHLEELREGFEITVGGPRYMGGVNLGFGPLDESQADNDGHDKSEDEDLREYVDWSDLENDNDT